MMSVGENMARRKGIADIVFVLDASGSMQDCIDGLKNNIGSFIDTLSGPQSTLIDWRGKVVGYRDITFDEEWYVDQPFVSSAEELKTQLGSLQAKGGYDEPESLLDALHKLVNAPPSESNQKEPDKWRSVQDAARVIVVFTDASYHEVMTYDAGKDGQVSDVMDSIEAERIHLFLFAPNLPCYEDLAQVDKSQWDPIEKPYVPNLKQISRDSDKFRDILIALAKGISSSIETYQTVVII
jgi:hypothetical protein